MEVIQFDIEDITLLDEFINIQDKYFTSETYIPTPKENLFAVLNKRNPFFNTAKSRFFILKQNEKFVARVLATIDSRRNDEEDATVGNLGYFESPDNMEIARPLLDSAVSWLKDSGAKSIQGPMDLHIYNNYRFMTEGFETSPFLSEPRNPRYYPTIFENYGFKELTYWRSWQIDKAELLKFHNFVASMLKRRKNIHGIEMSPIDIDNIEHALSELYETALDVFKQNFSYSEISREEFVAIFSKLKPFLAPKSFQIARNNRGEIVGFIYGLIDPFKPGRYIYHTFGVVKELRFSDITARLTIAQTENFADIYDESIAALTTSQKSIIERIKKPNRFYKMYELK